MKNVKRIALGISLSMLTLTWSASAFAECNVKGKMANDKAITIDKSNLGRTNLTIVLAESALRTEAGAFCVEIEKQDNIFVLNSYYTVLGEREDKLIQVIEIFKK